MWKMDQNLLTDLQGYVEKRWYLKDILLFIRRKYPDYKWSLPTLKRRLGYFGLRMVDPNIPHEAIVGAVLEELLNVGEGLGFRTMTKKLREVYHLKVKQEDVLYAMHAIDPEGVQNRTVGKKKKRPRGTFVSPVSILFLYPLSFPFRLRKLSSLSSAPEGQTCVAKSMYFL